MTRWVSSDQFVRVLLWRIHFCKQDREWKRKKKERRMGKKKEGLERRKKDGKEERRMGKKKEGWERRKKDWERRKKDGKEERRMGKKKEGWERRKKDWKEERRMGKKKENRQNPKLGSIWVSEWTNKMNRIWIHFLFVFSFLLFLSFFLSLSLSSLSFFLSLSFLNLQLFFALISFPFSKARPSAFIFVQTGFQIQWLVIQSTFGIHFRKRKGWGWRVKIEREIRERDEEREEGKRKREQETWSRKSGWNPIKKTWKLNSSLDFLVSFSFSQFFISTSLSFSLSLSLPPSLLPILSRFDTSPLHLIPKKVFNPWS